MCPEKGTRTYLTKLHKAYVGLGRGGGVRARSKFDKAWVESSGKAAPIRAAFPTTLAVGGLSLTGAGDVADVRNLGSRGSIRLRLWPAAAPKFPEKKKKGRQAQRMRLTYAPQRDLSSLKADPRLRPRQRTQTRAWWSHRKARLVIVLNERSLKRRRTRVKIHTRHEAALWAGSCEPTFASGHGEAEPLEDPTLRTHACRCKRLGPEAKGSGASILWCI